MIVNVWFCMGEIDRVFVEIRDRVVGCIDERCVIGGGVRGYVGKEEVGKVWILKVGGGLVDKGIWLV